MTGMLEVIIHITRNKQWQCRYCMRKEKDPLKEEVSDQGKGGHQERSCVCSVFSSERVWRLPGPQLLSSHSFLFLESCALDFLTS